MRKNASYILTKSDLKVTDGLMTFFEQKLCAVFLCKPKVNKSSLKHTTHLDGQRIAVPTWKLFLVIYRKLNYQGLHTLIVNLAFKKKGLWIKKNPPGGPLV
jgi:hypothetical protein